MSPSTPSRALTMPPASAVHDDLLPFRCNGDWYDGGGERGGSSSVAPPVAPVVAGGDSVPGDETSAVPLFGVPGTDSQRNGTAPARRL